MAFVIRFFVLLPVLHEWLFCKRCIFFFNKVVVITPHIFFPCKNSVKFKTFESVFVLRKCLNVKLFLTYKWGEMRAYYVIPFSVPKKVNTVTFRSNDLLNKLGSSIYQLVKTTEVFELSHTYWPSMSWSLPPVQAILLMNISSRQ